jgi:hypothetical protein
MSAKPPMVTLAARPPKSCGHFFLSPPERKWGGERKKCCCPMAGNTPVKKFQRMETGYWLTA